MRSTTRVARSRATPVSSTSNHAPSAYGAGEGVTRDGLSGRTYVFRGHTRDLDSVAVVPSASGLVSSSSYNTASRSRGRADHRLATAPPPPAPVPRRRLKPSSSGGRAASASASGSSSTRQGRASASLSVGNSSSRYVITGRPSEYRHRDGRPRGHAQPRRSRDPRRSTASSRARSQSRSRSKSRSRRQMSAQPSVVVVLDDRDAHDYDYDHDHDHDHDYHHHAAAANRQRQPDRQPPRRSKSSGTRYDAAKSVPRTSSTASSQSGRRRPRRKSSIPPPQPPAPADDCDDVAPPPPPPPPSSSSHQHHHNPKPASFRVGDGYVDAMVDTESEGEWSPGPASEDDMPPPRRRTVRNSAAPAGGSPTPSALRACATKASFYLQSAAPSSSLAGKGFVLFGNLQLLTAAEATQLIERHGGFVTPAITRNTSYVVIGGVDAIKRLSPRNAATSVAGGEPGMPPTLNEAGLLQLLSVKSTPPHSATPTPTASDAAAAEAEVAAAAAAPAVASRGRPRRRSSHRSTGSATSRPRSVSRSEMSTSARSPSPSRRSSSITSLAGKSVLLYRSVPTEQRLDLTYRIEAAGGTVTSHMGRADVCVSGPQRPGSPLRSRARTDSTADALPVLSISAVSALAPPVPYVDTHRGSSLLAESVSGQPVYVPSPPASPPPADSTYASPPPHQDPQSPPLSSPVTGVLGWKGPDVESVDGEVDPPVRQTLAAAPYAALEGWQHSPEEEEEHHQQQQQQDVQRLVAAEQDREEDARHDEAYHHVFDPVELQPTAHDDDDYATPAASMAIPAPVMGDTTVLSPALSQASHAAVHGSGNVRRPPLSPQPHRMPPIPTGAATPPAATAAAAAAAQLTFLVDDAPVTVPQYANLPSLVVAVRDALGYHPSAALTLHRGDTIITHASQVMPNDVLCCQAHATPADAARVVNDATHERPVASRRQPPATQTPARAAAPTTPYTDRTSPSMPSVRATPDSTSVASPHTDTLPPRSSTSAFSSSSGSAAPRPASRSATPSNPPTPSIEPPSTPVEDGDSENDYAADDDDDDDEAANFLNVSGVTNDSWARDGLVDGIVSDPDTSDAGMLSPLSGGGADDSFLTQPPSSPNRPLGAPTWIKEEKSVSVPRRHPSRSLDPDIYVLCGTFSRSRDELQAAIFQAGGHVEASVSPRTRFVVVGMDVYGRPAHRSTEYRLALRMNVEVIDEAQLVAQVSPGSSKSSAAARSPSRPTSWVASSSSPSAAAAATATAATNSPGGPRVVVLGTSVGKPTSPLRAARGTSLSMPGASPGARSSGSGVGGGGRPTTSPSRTRTPSRRRHASKDEPSCDRRLLVVASAVSPSTSFSSTGDTTSSPPPSQPLFVL